MKIGDRVVCINNYSPVLLSSFNLTIGNSYIITDISETIKEDGNHIFIHVFDDLGNNIGFNQYRFTNLKDDRLAKLKEIEKNSIKIK